MGVADLLGSGAQDAMTDDLASLVRVETPSSDPGSLLRGAQAVADLGTRLLGRQPSRTVVSGVPQLSWTATAAPTVLLLGHLDTVWPLGSLEDHPWRVDGGCAFGPGVFDMKAGLVQALHALAALDPSLAAHATLLVTADEEVSSPTSRPRILAEAARHACTLVLEAAAPGGALKTARRGVAHYRIDVTGRAAHAGLEPGAGVNAAIELAHQVLAVSALDASPAGASVVVTMLEGGSAVNTVPARASATVDARLPSAAEAARVEAGMRALAPVLPGARVAVTGGPTHPPLVEHSTAALHARAREVAAALGLDPPGGVHVGGASDGNTAASVGAPVLDGLGAVGGGAHADGEHVVLAEMPRRAALVAGLVGSLVGRPL